MDPLLNTVIRQTQAIFVPDPDYLNSLQETYSNYSRVVQRQSKEIQSAAITHDDQLNDQEEEYDELDFVLGNSKSAWTVPIHPSVDPKNFLPEYKSISDDDGYQIHKDNKKFNWTAIIQNTLSSKVQKQVEMADYVGREQIFFNFLTGEVTSLVRSRVLQDNNDKKAFIHQSQNLQKKSSLMKGYNEEVFDERIMVMNFKLQVQQDCLIRWMLVQNAQIDFVKSCIKKGTDNKLENCLNEHNIKKVLLKKGQTYFFNIVINKNDQKGCLLELVNTSNTGSLPHSLIIQRSFLIQAELDQMIKQLYTPVDGLHSLTEYTHLDKPLHYSRVVQPLRLIRANVLIDINTMNGKDGIHSVSYEENKSTKHQYVIAFKHPDWNDETNSGLYPEILFEFEKSCDLIGLFTSNNKVWFVQVNKQDDAVVILEQRRLYDIPIELVKDIYSWGISFTGKLIFADKDNAIIHTHLMQNVNKHRDEYSQFDSKKSLTNQTEMNLQTQQSHIQ